MDRTAAIRLLVSLTGATDTPGALRNDVERALFVLDVRIAEIEAARKPIEMPTSDVGGVGDRVKIIDDGHPHRLAAGCLITRIVDEPAVPGGARVHLLTLGGDHTSAPLANVEPVECDGCLATADEPCPEDCPRFGPERVAVIDDTTARTAARA